MKEGLAGAGVGVKCGLAASRKALSLSAQGCLNSCLEGADDATSLLWVQGGTPPPPELISIWGHCPKFPWL